MSKDTSELNGAFSGVDVIAYMIFPGNTPICIGNASTITYSTYRGTKPVRTLGRINPKGMVKGSRTIAGTIIFTVLHKHVVNMIKTQVPYLETIKKLKPCELPPFDLLLTYGNEYGAGAHMAIYGVSIVDEGKIFSIEDMFTENTWSYIARDIDLLDDLDSLFYSPLTTLGEYDQGTKFKKEDLVLDDDYVKMKEALEQMKKDKKALIDKLRKNSDLYTGNAGDWVPGQDIDLVAPNGAQFYEDDTLDINKENHPKIEIEIVKGHQTPTTEQDDVWIPVQISVDMGSAKGNKEVKMLKEGGVRLVATMGDDSCGMRTKSGEWVEKKMTVKFINFQQHTPSTPNITVGVNLESFEVDGKKYVLTSEKEVKIQNPKDYNVANYNTAKVVEFMYVPEGSEKAKEAEKEDNMTFTMSFHANSYTTLPSIKAKVDGGIDFKPRRSGKNVQYVFRDAMDEAVAANRASFGCTTGNTVKDFYTTVFVTPPNIRSGHCTNVSSKIPEEKLIGSFNACCEIKESGKVVTPKNHKDMVVRCTYRCKVFGQASNEITLDGKNANTNVTKVPQYYNRALQQIGQNGEIDLDTLLSGTTIYPYLGMNGVNTFNFMSHTDNVDSDCVADYIVDATHETRGCYGYTAEGSNTTSKTLYRSNPQIVYRPVNGHSGQTCCKCNMTHNKLEFELYDFTLYDKKTGKSVPNTGTTKSIYFEVVNLSTSLYQAL